MNPLYLRLVLTFVLAGGLYAGSGAYFESAADRPFDSSKFIIDWLFFGFLMVALVAITQRKALFKKDKTE